MGGANVNSTLFTGTTVSVSGNITGGNLNAAGLSLSSNVVSALVSAANITTTANISGGFILGNGSALTGITASVSKISNGTSEANIGTSAGNANITIAGTSNVAVFTTAGLNITGIVSATGNITGGNLSGSIIHATNNGAGTNFRVGDDAWIGDINVADTMSIRGQQSALNGYIVFGNADGTQLGRAGSGPLTYGGAFSATGNVTGGNVTVAELFYNSTTVDSSFTTPAGFNAHAAGPVVVQNGVIGTVSNSTTWIVI